MTINTSNLILSFLFIIAFSSCNLINDESRDNSSTLPPITMSGENTFGCLIDENLFLPVGSLIGASTGTGINPKVSFDEASGTFKIFASNSRTGYSFYLIVDQPLNSKGTYKLLNSSFYYNFDLGDCESYFILPEISQLNLLKLDKDNDIASGTFYGEFINTCNDTLVISEGRFDANYVL